MKVRSPGFRIRSSYETVFSADGEHLLVVGRDIVLWSVRSRKRLRSTRIVTHPSSADFAPDAGSFLVKNTVGELVRFDTATLQPDAWHRPAQRDEGPGPVFLGDSIVLDGSWDGTIRLRGDRDLVPRVLWSDEDTRVTRVARFRGGWAALVSASHTHPAFEAGADQVLFGDVLQEQPPRSFGRTWRFLRNMALTAAGDRLAVLSGAPPKDLEILDTSTRITIATGTADVGGTGGHLAWSPDGTTLVVAERGGFSFRSALDLRECAWFGSQYAAHASYSPDGTLICLGDWGQGTVLPWPEIISEY